MNVAWIMRNSNFIEFIQNLQDVAFSVLPHVFCQRTHETRQWITYNSNDRVILYVIP